jgi:RNA polymerase sigma-70 factor (ECF subfamily)
MAAVAPMPELPSHQVKNSEDERSEAPAHTSEDELSPQATSLEVPLHSALGDFAAVYEEHAQPIYYLTLRMLGDPAQAEDAAHDVFLKAWRKWREFRGDSAVRTWLYRIAINHCRNLLQSWHHRHVVLPEDNSLQDSTPSAADSPLRVLEVKELGQRIQKTLDGMPEEYNLLLLLVADEGLSYNEVAELTNQTADAVRGKLHRARRAFAARFQQLG